MTTPCPRCAELEARLSSAEREMFEALRARVEELETEKEQLTKERDHNAALLEAETEIRMRYQRVYTK